MSCFVYTCYVDKLCFVDKLCYVDKLCRKASLHSVSVIVEDSNEQYMKILENFFLAFLGFLKAQFLMVRDTFLSCFLWLLCRCFLIMLPCLSILKNCPSFISNSGCPCNLLGLSWDRRLLCGRCLKFEETTPARSE